MEVLNKLWDKVGLKKKHKPVIIKISNPVMKSCGNCEHYRYTVGLNKCMHYPEAAIHEVNIKSCKPEERPLWSEKRRGVFSRFFDWLF